MEDRTMKKTALIICAVLLALVSCNKQLETPDEGNAAATEITFNLDATHPDGGDTKAVKTGWETGDVIFVFFNKQAAPAYLEMKRESDGTWTSTGKNSLSLVESESGTMTAVYLPFGSGATVSADGTNFKFSETYLSYYLTAQLSYTVSGGEVSGTFDMKIPDGFVQFFLEDASADPSVKIEIREPHLSQVGIDYIYGDGRIAHTFVDGAPLPGYVYKGGYLFSGVLNDGAINNEVNYHFTLVKGNWRTGEYYSKEYTNKKLYTSASTGRALKLAALTGTNWTPITDYKPIDLGCDIKLVASTVWNAMKYRRVYWSSRNLGATHDFFPASSSDADKQATWGDYYAWGEVEPYYKPGYAYQDLPDVSGNPNPGWKTGKEGGYAWSSYSLNPSGDGTTFSHYTGSDYNVLFLGHDAARHNAGGLWRMPTEIECGALNNNEKFTWTWDATNGGYVVMSNTPGYTDRYIFLPAAGNRNVKLLTNEDSYGKYWSSVHRDGEGTSLIGNAYGLWFHSTAHTANFETRYFGKTVRPVMD